MTTSTEATATSTTYANLVDITIDGTTYRYTDHDTQVISNGNTYTPISLDISEIGQTRNGTLQRIDINPSNVTDIGTNWLASNEIRGSEVKVYACFPDDPNNTTVLFTGKVTAIPVVTRGTFTLSCVSKRQFAKRIPKRTYAAYCPWTYKPTADAQSKSTPCPFSTVTATTYATSTEYDRLDVVGPVDGTDIYAMALNSGTSDSSAPTWTTTNGDRVTDNDITWFIFDKTKCGKTKNDCEARNGSAAPFGGFMPWRLR